MGMRWGQAKAGGTWPDTYFLSTWPGPTSETANCNSKMILFEPLFHPNFYHLPATGLLQSHRIRVDAPDVCLWNAHTGFKALGRRENKVRVQRGRASLVAQTVKNPPAMQETWVRFLGLEDPWRRAWQPTPVFLPGESHGQRSLVGYSPWGHKELNMTERISIA